jgi:hypothetical protein
LRGSILAAISRGLTVAAIFVVGAIAEITATSGLSPHCTAMHTVGSTGPDPSPWMTGELFTIVGPAFLIALVIYVVLRTPLGAPRSATRVSVCWSAVAGSLIAFVGLRSAGSDYLC